MSKKAKDGHKPPLWSEAMYGSAHGEWESLSKQVLKPNGPDEQVKSSRILQVLGLLVHL